MSGKKGKGGKPLVSNILEGMGELGSQKIGKWLGDFILSLIPALSTTLGGLNKDSVLDLVPYIGTLFLKNEILQDSTEGFLRGLSDSLRAKRGEIPDDPGQQKAFFVSLLGPSFDKLKTDLEGKKGQKPKGLLVAAAGLQLHEQNRLWNRISTAGEMEAIVKVAFGTDITTDELRVVIAMVSPDDSVKWLLARLTPPAKPQSTMDKMRHRAEQFLARTADKYLDPKGEGLKKFEDEQKAHAKSLETGNAEIAKIFGL